MESVVGRSANDVPRSPHKKRREKIEGLSREWQHDGDGHYRPVPDGREVHLCRGEKKNERDEWGTPRPGGWPKERKTTKNEGDNKERKRACVPATASDHLLSSANGDLAATEDVQQTAAGTDSPVPRSGPSPGAKQRRRRRKKKKSGGLCLDDNKQEAASSTALATDKNGVEGSAEQEELVADAVRSPLFRRTDLVEEKQRCLCGILMPSMVTTDLDKLSTAFLQLEPHHLLFSRLHFKGGGRRLTVDELEEDKVSIPKFIFADVEAFPFQITLKEYGASNWQVMASARGMKEKEGDSYRLATMEPENRTSWLAHMQPKDSAVNHEDSKEPSEKMHIKAGRSFGPPKYDFLWLRRKENTWCRYFCMSSGDYLEWYTLGPVKSIPLDSILSIEKGKKTETLRMGRSDSKIKRNWIRSYDTWIQIAWKNEYGFDSSNRFYFGSSDEAAVWLDQLSRYGNSLLSSPSPAADPPLPERLLSSAPGQMSVAFSPINTQGQDKEADGSPKSLPASPIPLSQTPPMSPRDPPERTASLVNTPSSTAPPRKRSRRSNSVGHGEERKWSELVSRVLRRDPDRAENSLVSESAETVEERDLSREDADDLGASLPRGFLDIRLPSPSFSFSSTWLQTVMENRKSNKYRKYSLEDVDSYMIYDRGEGRMRFFTQSTSVKDPSVSRALNLRNTIRGFVERANNETGKTGFGNYISLSPREEDQATRPFFILCLDGGGLKSILEAAILERLVAEFPDLLDRVSLFAGVSGGSMLCSCLAAGRSAMFIRALMEGIMPHLVEGERSMNTVAGFGMKKAKYTHAAMSICGEEILNGIKMSELPKKLLITSFLLDNVDSMDEGDDRSWQARAYHNLPIHHDDSDEEEHQQRVLNTPVWEFVMGSSSAPSFFPSYKKHIDGGVVANNPSLTSAITVTGLKAKDRQKLENLRILSLGTGTVRKYLDGDQHDWGLLKWGPKLTEVLFGAANNNVDMLTTMMLGKFYHRLDPHMEEKLPMDDPSIAAKLVELGRTIDLDDTIDWIRVYIYGGEPTRKMSRDELEKQKLKARQSRKSATDTEDSEDSNESQESDEEGDDEAPQDIRNSRKSLQTVKRIWNKKKARHPDSLHRKAHTCDLSMLHQRADSTPVDVLPPYHHQHYQASTDEEEETHEPISIETNDRDSPRLFNDTRRRAKMLKMHAPFTGKLKKRSTKYNTTVTSKESKKVTLSSALWTTSTSTSWSRQRSCMGEELVEEGGEFEIEDVEIESGRRMSHPRNDNAEDEGTGGLEKATGILKTIFGLH